MGGVKEKVLAAVRFGVKHVILPEANKPDWLEVPAEVRAMISSVVSPSRFPSDTGPASSAPLSTGKPAKTTDFAGAVPPRRAKTRPPRATTASVTSSTLW